MHIVIDDELHAIIIIGNFLSLNNQFIDHYHELHFNSFHFIFQDIMIKLDTQEEISYIFCEIRKL